MTRNKTKTRKMSMLENHSLLRILEHKNLLFIKLPRTDNDTVDLFLVNGQTYKTGLRVVRTKTKADRPVWQSPRTLESTTTKEECTLESKSCLESVAAPTPALTRNFKNL